MFSYIFEASVEGLKLLPGELCLGLELVEALWLMSYHGEFKVTVTAVCQWETEQTRERDGEETKEG